MDAYLAFKGLIRVPWDIYLRFRGLVAKYERLQNGMVPMAIGAQYSRYHVSAPPRNVDRCFATVESTPRNADSPLFSPLSAPIHLSVHDFQWAIGKGSSQTAPRTVFVLYDDNQLGRDIQGRGEDSTLPGFRAPISTIHARRFGNGQYYENTSSLDVQAKWKSCTTPPTSATRGGRDRKSVV